MRSYAIDEVSTADIRKIREYLEEHSERSSIEDLYWLNVPEGLLAPTQAEHTECQPYCVAIEVGSHSVRFELLVRSRVNHRCGCACYADHRQREFVLAFADHLIEELLIRT